MTPEELKLIEACVQALGTIAAALIVGIVSTRIAQGYAREKDRQDKESQWRQHAIELTKLDLERKIATLYKDPNRALRPCIQDFLANYRDLSQLDAVPPGTLYEAIRVNRTSKPESTQTKTEDAE